MPLHLLEDSSLVYSQDGRRLFSLDTLATYIWLRFEEGWDNDKIRRNLLASKDIKNVIKLDEQIETLRVLYREELSQEKRSSAGLDGEKIAGRQGSVAGKEKRTPCYLLLDTSFTFQCNTSRLVELISSHFSHLRIGASYPEYIIEISEAAEGISLIINQELIQTKLRFNQVLPCLFYQLRCIAADNIDYLFAVHAAALTKDDHCLLFPARSGSGKSILSSIMLADGFQFLTDELVAIESLDQRIRPLPLGLGIKASGWQEVARYFPRILEIPCQQRLDGVEVRYLPVDKNSIACAKGHKVSHIIFPRFDARAPGMLRQLSSVEALCALADAGYYLPQGLNEARLIALLNWLSSCTIHEMTYRNSQQARCFVQQVTGLALVP